ncbi:MAG TPA: hypothetical protein VM223_17440 [Planctomycetota bacterium]|nr:hypothetical protein [Planctomycetota bacterium]
MTTTSDRAITLRDVFRIIGFFGLNCCLAGIWGLLWLGSISKAKYNDGIVATIRNQPVLSDYSLGYRIAGGLVIIGIIGAICLLTVLFTNWRVIWAPAVEAEHPSQADLKQTEKKSQIPMTQ